MYTDSHIQEHINTWALPQYTHVHTQSYMHIWATTYKQTCTHRHRHTLTQRHILMHVIHRLIHTDIHRRRYTEIYTPINIHTKNANIYTQKFIHTCMHTHIITQFPLKSFRSRDRCICWMSQHSLKYILFDLGGNHCLKYTSVFVI